MSLIKKLSSISALAVAFVVFGGYAAAQDTAAPSQDGVQKTEKQYKRGMKAGKRGGMRGMHRGGFGLHGIELTDAQKEQIKAIRMANKPSEAEMAEMKSIREARKAGGELTADQKAKMQAFRDARKAKMETVHAQILAILTPDQRTQLEAKKAEMQQRREEFRQKRQERKAAREAAKPTEN
jgi:Spy/CpxP family protein refolding chaperone